MSKLLNGELSSPEVGKDNDMVSMADTITDIIDKNSSDSRTVSLWKLYLRLTHLLRLMIFAERTGNFLLHLHCMELYIPVFHAAGHFTSPLYGTVHSSVSCGRTFYISIVWNCTFQCFMRPDILHLHCMELYIPVFHAAGHFTSPLYGTVHSSVSCGRTFCLC